MSEYGFGIVGCGVIAKFHVAALKEISNARLVAVNDVIERNARWLGEEQGVEWCTEIDQMLARDDVDIVVICTPSGFHGAGAVKAANAGKHVVVEKPLETTLAKCDAVIEAAERNHVKKLCHITRVFFKGNSKERIPMFGMAWLLVACICIPKKCMTI